MSSKKTLKVLFVCLGNICRSPAAHGTMLHILSQKSISNVEADSCGTGSWHTGDLPDSRMRKAAKTRGIELTHRARQLNKSDFTSFDIIVTMDDDNYSTVLGRGAPKDKVKKMIDFVSDKKGNDEIPDPYYGGEDGFHLVLDLVYDGCINILKQYGHLN